VTARPAAAAICLHTPPFKDPLRSTIVTCHFRNIDFSQSMAASSPFPRQKQKQQNPSKGASQKRRPEPKFRPPPTIRRSEKTLAWPSSLIGLQRELAILQCIIKRTITHILLNPVHASHSWITEPFGPAISESAASFRIVLVKGSATP